MAELGTTTPEMEAPSPLVSGEALDKLVSDASASPNVDIEGITRKAGQIKREEMAAKEPLYQKQANTLQDDRYNIHDKYAGIEAPDLKPWNAEEQSAKNKTNPMDSFGSAASVFAMIASAFTRTPMVSALNGAAGAMEAINANDDKAYDRAYTAWKDNSTLAIKNHDIQRSAFSDAIKLFEADNNAGTAELKTVAARFGDKQAQALLEGGYIKELVELEQGRANSARHFLQSIPAIEKMNTDRQMLKLDPDYSSGDPVKQRAALERIKEGKLTPEQEIYGQFSRENPNASPEEKLEFQKKIKETLQVGASGNAMNLLRAAAATKRMEEIKTQREAEGKPVTSQDMIDALAAATATDASQQRREKQEADEEKGKPLPSALQTSLGKKADGYAQMKSAVEKFQDGFAGYKGSTTAGELDLWIAKNLGTKDELKKDSAQWWADYAAYRNVARNSIFGSALTAHEKAEWEKQDITLGMTDDAVKKRLSRQAELVEIALGKEANSLAAQGYSKKGIRARIGSDNLKFDEQGYSIDESGQRNSPKPGGGAQPSQTLPPEAVGLLKEGAVTKLKDVPGRWTLMGGKPVKVGD